MLRVSPSQPEISDPRSRNREQWLVLAAAFLGWMFDGVEQGVFPLVARPALQDLLGTDTDRLIGPWMGYITAMFLGGAACGGVLFGWIGDRVGRVRAMIGSILAYSLLTGCCYFVQSPAQLGVFRFLAAIGMGGEWSLGVALVMECWPERHRPVLAGAIGASANVGFGLLGALGTAFQITRGSWRWVMLAGAAPALLALFIARYVPESRRWSEARKSSRFGPLQEVLSPTLRRTTLVGIGVAAVALVGTWGSVQWLPAWADQLTQGKSQTAKGLTQALIAAGAVVGCFFGPWVGARSGRRTAYCLLCLLSLAGCSVLFRFVSNYSPTFLLMTFVVGATTAAMYGWLPLYLPELFPTAARATGQGLCYNSGRVLAAIGAIQMGRLLQFYDGSYARAGAVITLVYIVGLVLIWFGPETKGRPLPQ